jgi:hypothetical protein
VKARGKTVLAAVLVLSAVAGAWLRTTHVETWPPGPWVDEAYALRAARLLPEEASLFGTSALTPPGEGFVNAWTPNLYLRFTNSVDRAAGGGLASFRALSVLPALVLLAGLFALAFEAARGRPFALGTTVALGASAMWLLTTGRWGWNAVATSALVVLATAAAFVAARTASPGWAAGWAAASGVLAGLGIYGYAAGRLLLAAPALVLAVGLPRRDPGGRRRAIVAGIALAVAGAVALPLLVDFGRHPDRAFAREREISVFRGGVRAACAALARNVTDYAALFFLHGDANERHGDPARPVLPVAVSGLALVGTAFGFRRPCVERAVALPAALALLGGLLASEPTGANAYRISPAAPFLIVLAGLGADRLLAGLPVSFRRVGAISLTALVAVSAALDGAGFVRWAESPRTWGAFGGPERELADALSTAQVGGPRRIVLNFRTASRNAYVVEELLAPPGRRSGPVVLFADLSLERTPLRESVLYADGGELAEIPALGGHRGDVLARGRDPWNRPTFVVYGLGPDPR